MPRKIAPQVGQSLSRLLKGGYLKSPPIAYHALLAHPPSSLPARAPTPRTAYDMGQPAGAKKAWYESDVEAKDAELDAAAAAAGLGRNSPALSSRSSSRRGDASSLPSTSAAGASGSSPAPPQHRRDRLNSRKRAHALMPKLFPQPIVYLADRVRQRFYNDHPWEAFAPRTLAEGRTLAQPRVVAADATDLAAWGRNPQPEDVVACTIHLHTHHGLSLSQAYHHTLSSYVALRAEHEHASRSAILEARAYGAVFAIGADGLPTAATETERGFRKESEELRKGAAWINAGGLASVSGVAGGSAGAAAAGILGGGTLRTKNTWLPSSRGVAYLQHALAARDNVAIDHSAASAQPAIESSSSLLDQLAASRANATPGRAGAPVRATATAIPRQPRASFRGGEQTQGRSGDDEAVPERVAQRGA